MARCGSCGKTGGCEHISPAVDFKFEVEKPNVAVPEPAPQVYVPGVRDYSAAPASSGGAETRGPAVVYGARGEKGDRGNVGQQGLPGAPGKDANIEECIDAATLAMTVELDRMRVDIRTDIVAELKKAGAIDEAGRAILVAGPAGRDGRDGATGARGVPGVGQPGRDGIDGKSITGPQGVPGKDGSIEEATRAAKDYVNDAAISLRLSMRETIIMLLKERGVLDVNGAAVPGPQGKEGIPGPQGKPGNIASAVANCEKYVQEELAKFKEEIRAKLEAK